MSDEQMVVTRAYEASVEEFFGQVALGQAVAFGSAEFGEGVYAFLSKRKLRFNR